MSVTVLDISKATRMIIKVDRVISKAEKDEIRKVIEKQYPLLDGVLIIEAGQSITFV